MTDRDHEQAHGLSCVARNVRLARYPTIPSLIAGLLASADRRTAIQPYRQGSALAPISYPELLDRIAGYANAIGALGARRGDRIALVAPNGVEFCAAALAVMAIGAIVVPINETDSSDAIAYVLDHAGAKLALCAEHLSIPDGPWRRVSFAELAGAASHPRRVADVDPDDPAVIVYTSGTTSRPKGVCLSHYNLCVNAEALQERHALTSESTSMCVLPLCFMNAFGFSLITTLYAGARLVLCDELPGPGLWEIIARERVGVISLVPALLRLLLLRPRRAAQVPALSHVISAAAPLSTSLARELHEATGIPILQGYGLTETTNFSTTMPMAMPDEVYRRLMHGGEHPSIGPALRGCELAVSEAGELLIRGHSVMLGYWRDAEATREAFRGGWFHSGDLGYASEIDGTAYYFVAGRIKEIIIRGGRNLSPLAIEHQLAALAELGPFAVVGVANIHVGEEVGVYVCGGDTPERRARVAQIISACPEPSRPRFAALAAEPIGVTRTAKVQRRALARRFEGCATVLSNPHSLHFVDVKQG